MTKRILLLSLFCSLLGISAGCHVACWQHCEPSDPDLNWGPGSATCDSEPACGDCGGGGCGRCGVLARCRARRACVDDCGDCGDCGGCGPVRGRACGEPACRVRPIVGPLSWLASLFTHDSYWGGSCGQYRYWGDFYGDPPDICDPCDDCGNYTGRGCQDGCQDGGIVRRGGCPTCGNQDYARAVESPRPTQVATRKVTPQPAPRKTNPQVVNRPADPRRSAATATPSMRTVSGNPQPAAAPTMTVVGDRVLRPAVASENDPIIASKIISETDRVVSSTTEEVAEGPQPRPATRR
jgi:hypothetical protein